MNILLKVSPGIQFSSPWLILIEIFKQTLKKTLGTLKAKKLDFMRAKEKEYRASLEKKEASLARNGGGDTTLR